MMGCCAGGLVVCLWYGVTMLGGVRGVVVVCVWWCSGVVCVWWCGDGVLCGWSCSMFMVWCGGAVCGQLVSYHAYMV